MKLGIINPDWTLQRHNTDQRCVMDFLDLGRFTEGLSVGFVGSKLDYFRANMNFLSERLANRRVFGAIELPSQRLEADVFYEYGAQPMGLTISRKSRKPLISTLGFPILSVDKSRGQRYLEHAAADLVRQAQFSTAVHFHTDAMREGFLALRPAWRQKCVTIPFFLPHLQVAPEHEIRAKFAENETRLLFVGIDGQRKGIEELSEALDAISDFLQAHKVRATFISKTKPACHRFRDFSHFESMARDDVQKLMRSSHLYVMVPRRESFGLVFVEAMAAGCAVVADNDVPRQEILDEGRCGRLLQPGNPALIASALQTLIEDRPAMQSMALLGWSRAQSRYAPQHVACQYAMHFRKLMAESMGR